MSTATPIAPSRNSAYDTSTKGYYQHRVDPKTPIEDIAPIPGAKRRAYLEENLGALDVALTPDDLARIDAVAPRGAASGERYPAQALQAVNL